MKKGVLCENCYAEHNVLIRLNRLLPPIITIVSLLLLLIPAFGCYTFYRMHHVHTPAVPSASTDATATGGNSTGASDLVNNTSPKSSPSINTDSAPIKLSDDQLQKRLDYLVSAPNFSEAAPLTQNQMMDIVLTLGDRGDFPDYCLSSTSADLGVPPTHCDGYATRAQIQHFIHDLLGQDLQIWEKLNDNSRPIIQGDKLGWWLNTGNSMHDVPHVHILSRREQASGVMHAYFKIMYRDGNLSNNPPWKAIGKGVATLMFRDGSWVVTDWNTRELSSSAPVVHSTAKKLPIMNVNQNIAKTGLLTDSDLAGKSKWQLDLIRNEYFARKGYRFQRADLRNYFQQQPWYHPVTSDQNIIWKQLTPQERLNAELILHYEAQHGMH
jgi:hypothetical protein